MGPRLLRAISNTLAVFAVLAGLIGSGLALVLSVYTRYDAEPWKNSKDSVERAIKFLRSDLHRNTKD